MMNEVLKFNDSKLPEIFYKFEFRCDVSYDSRCFNDAFSLSQRRWSFWPSLWRAL